MVRAAGDAMTERYMPIGRRVVMPGGEQRGGAK
jgi:hypothetical protein